MAYEYIKTENREGVLVLTMHDPPTRNALGPEMASEVRAELDRFEDDPECRVLLITGTEPSFSSGANVRNFNRNIEEAEAAGAEPESLPWGKMEARFANRDDRVAYAGGAPLVPLRIHKLQKPSIAAVNGHAMGVGMGVALACDIRIAAEGAIFSEAFSRMGLIPGDGSCWQLPVIWDMGIVPDVQVVNQPFTWPERLPTTEDEAVKFAVSELAAFGRPDAEERIRRSVGALFERSDIYRPTWRTPSDGMVITWKTN